MIYLFRKRNGQIVATTKESAHSMYATPNNFVTFQPVYLGAVTPTAFRNISDQAETDVPIQIELLVKKDGEDTLITLSAGQIADKIEEGDKKVERQYEAVLTRQRARYNELLEELASQADKSIRPTSYTHKIAAIEDAKGDPRREILSQYVHE